MSHNYHPHCGCADCDKVDEAAERREEDREAFIEAGFPVTRNRLLDDEDFVSGAISDLLSEDDTDDVRDCLTEMYRNYREARDATEEARAGMPLYQFLNNALRPKAEERARDDLGFEFDRDNPQD